MSDVVCLPRLEELQDYVHQTLCAKDRLDPSQSPLQIATLVQRGKPCGLFFQVNGPRMLKNYAIWTEEQSRILFYGADGERYAETLVSEGPSLKRAA